MIPIQVISKGDIGNWPEEITAYTDGASRNNPGPASFGLSVVDKEKNIIFEEACFLGKKTNNEAEYLGIYRVLELSAINKVKKLFLKTDSQLIARQLQGIYKIKSPHLKPIYKKCIRNLKHIPQYKIIHILREKNKRADELANLALDGK